MPEIPEEFPKIIKDFISDIENTFPEYKHIIGKWWNTDNPDYQLLFNHCVDIFPERFIDILYQKTEIFDVNSNVNTDFLPGISFKYLWNCEISDKTRETIWKYLQMVLICNVGNLQYNTFGDTSKLFESINESEFKEKLVDTIEHMQTIFENTQNKNTSIDIDSSKDTSTNINDNISSMLGGKLGDLAREIAEESSGNLGIDMENITDDTNITDIFQKLFKNPGNLMNLVKSVSEKLDSRVKSGDINQNELMSEASEMLNKMKGMPGMENIQEMISKMGGGGLGLGGGGLGGTGLTGDPGIDGLNDMAKLFGMGKNAKLDTNAIQRNEKNAKMKERLRQKMEAKKMSELVASVMNTTVPKDPVITDEELISIFSTGENIERTPRNQKKRVKESINK